LDPPEEKCGFSEMEIFIEFKRHVSDDPFRYKPLPKGAFVHNTGSSKGTWGQMGSYAAAVLGMQFRIHLYSILICGKYARLVRWECDHAVVTEHFDYQNSKNPLTEFIWQYSQLDSIQWGHDPTITEWNESDPRNEWLQTEKEEMKGQNNLHLRFRQMVINDRDDPMIEKNFLFSYLQNFTLHSPFGRGTRGMTGCDVDLEGCRIAWCTSRTIGGWKGERKKERFIGPLRRRMFPIFPDSTVGMMCVMQYAGIMTLSRWTMTLGKCLMARKDPRQYPKSGHQNGLSYIPTHMLSYIIEWPCIELVGS